MLSGQLGDDTEGPVQDPWGSAYIYVYKRYCPNVSQHECPLGEGVCLPMQKRVVRQDRRPVADIRWAWTLQQSLMSFLWSEQAQPLWPDAVGSWSACSFWSLWGWGLPDRPWGLWEVRG